MHINQVILISYSFEVPRYTYRYVAITSTMRFTRERKYVYEYVRKYCIETHVLVLYIVRNIWCKIRTDQTILTVHNYIYHGYHQMVV